MAIEDIYKTLFLVICVLDGMAWAQPGHSVHILPANQTKGNKMYDLDLIADQDKREQQDLEQIEAWGMDQAALEQILRRWGSRQVMTALANIHQHVAQDRSKLEWRILSHAYLTGGYDDPNPCSCDEIF